MNLWTCDKCKAETAVVHIFWEPQDPRYRGVEGVSYKLCPPCFVAVGGKLPKAA